MHNCRLSSPWLDGLNCCAEAPPGPPLIGRAGTHTKHSAARSARPPTADAARAFGKSPPNRLRAGPGAALCTTKSQLIAIVSPPGGAPGRGHTHIGNSEIARSLSKALHCTQNRIKINTPFRRLRPRVYPSEYPHPRSRSMRRSVHHIAARSHAAHHSTHVWPVPPSDPNPKLSCDPSSTHAPTVCPRSHAASSAAAASRSAAAAARSSARPAGSSGVLLPSSAACCPPSSSLSCCRRSLCARKDWE